MADAHAPRSTWQRIWKWLAGGFGALVAIAGFASPEFRAATCLDLPSSAELQYPPEQAGAVSFHLIGTQSQQQALDGKDLVFRARYYGETFESVYKPFLGPDKQQGFAFLNLRPLDFVVEDTPLGPTSAQLPAAMVMLPIDAAARLSALSPGQVVEFHGKGRWLSGAEPGSKMAQSGLSLALADTNDFYIIASQARVLEPVNAPESRMLCRLFHDTKAQAAQ